MRFVPVMVPLLALALAACGDDGNKNNHDAAPDTAPVDTTPVDTGPDAPHLPIFRNPVSTADGQLATQALAILGEPDNTECSGCHGLTRSHLTYWRSLSDTTMSNCLVDLSVSNQQSALDMINCLRTDPTDTSTPFQTQKLGIYATAVYLPWFQYVFYRAYGAQWQTYLTQFQQQVGMPRGGQPQLTQEQFDIVAEWFTRGLPYLNNETPPDGDPAECLTYQTADVAAHTTTLATTGWRAVNSEGPAHLAMYGCGSATTALDCLSDRPRAADTTYGATWDAAGSTIRILADLPNFSSSYWSRSSPDGRWIGQGRNDGNVGNGWGASILDLQTRSADAPTQIPVNSLYDPAFFPDNSGWVFQPSAHVCTIASLQDTMGNDLTGGVSYSSAGCAQAPGVGLYQHVGRALAGGDYFAISGQFMSDSGGEGTTFGDTDASFSQGAQVSFTPMILSNGTYSQKPVVTETVPYEGDSVLSPSATLVMSRFEDSAGTHGYVLRKMNATPAGSTYTIALPEIARYCIAGEKPAFSYDERWVVYHHYISPTSNDDAQDLGFSSAADPGYAAYRSQGTSNLYLMSLDTGAKIRITNMAPGQYALFPHFRSDGWIYADVRVPAHGGNPYHEYYMANDAALVAEGPHAMPRTKPATGYHAGAWVKPQSRSAH